MYLIISAIACGSRASGPSVSVINGRIGMAKGTCRMEHRSAVGCKHY